MTGRYITARFSLRKGIKSEWEAEDPVLNEGEPGFETDTKRLKLGDGVTNWTNLNYYQIGDSESTGTFIHDGSVLPAHINSVSSAIDYLGSRYKLLNEHGHDEFNNGVTGDPSLYMFTVTSSSGGAASHSKGADGTATDGETVQVNASAFPGYEFDYWEGPVVDANSASTDLVVDGNHFIRANFKLV